MASSNALDAKSLNRAPKVFWPLSNRPRRLRQATCWCGKAARSTAGQLPWNKLYLQAAAPTQLSKQPHLGLLPGADLV